MDFSQTTIDACFPASYRQARELFLEACRRRRLPLTSCFHPMAGPDGEPLATDAVWVGAADAAGVVVVTSATHGIEGFGGSGIQTALLADETAPAPGADTALMLIHAVNPWGFAWQQRTNEDNVDLNRNFVDHAAGHYPDNPLFEVLAEHVIPARWEEDAIAACESAIRDFESEHGGDAVRLALTRGQYTHSDNIHFGGNGPAWSNRTLRELCRMLLGNARRAVLIDLHTGLGPYGHGELMTPSRAGDPVHDRLHAWFGDQLHSTAGSPRYAGAPGSILAGFAPPLEHLEFTAVGLEFGTRARDVVDRAIRADAWLHRHPGADRATVERLRRLIRDAFYPDDGDWRLAIWRRAAQVVEIALDRVRTPH